MPVQLTANRLHSVKDPHFMECWALYEESFPSNERRTLLCQQAAMTGAARESFHCLRLEQGGCFAGILFYWERQDFIYVEHLAICPGLRGLGVGHAALAFVCDQGIPVILEIEPVADEFTERRWRFYRSAGFHRLPYPHLQPAYHCGDIPLALELLSYPHAMSECEVRSYEAFMREVVSLYTEAGLQTAGIPLTLDLHA